MSCGSDDFTFRKFPANSWEKEVKQYISGLDSSTDRIWYRSPTHKKLNEELVTLGYYVKYDRGEVDHIWFQLLRSAESADGEIGEGEEVTERVQIAIAHYQAEEAKLDDRMESGQEPVDSGWASERLVILRDRIIDRLSKKANKHYSGVGTLCVGSKGWFVRRALAEHPSLIEDLRTHWKTINDGTFRKVVIVDTDLVGSGTYCVL
ncbi:MULTISPECIES: hypothetical protein [Halomonadaceae]|uniref:Uncharacterized protein n=1 Tax=Vreelandella halophila TaxID=86177 RepID=A0A9X5B2P5_9GAMM|nr:MULTISPECIES: hypothetical protein [Halomonas]MYL25166.1 hypothetical protein [Halomonas utahensis]MYL75228.1 hypothetical protein [Halomonas sp. 22501_18_FS]